MAIDPTPQKAQLPAFKKALRRILRHGKYWISKDEVTALLVFAGPFTISEIIREMGYSITDQDDNGAIHIAATP